MDFKELKNKIIEIENWLTKEFKNIRTGAASPMILDNIRVNVYNSMMPINQLATVGVENARTLVITPWDKSQTKNIEKAITQANLGISVIVNDTGILINMPEMTGETRDKYIKIAKEKLEQARILLKQERNKTWSQIQEKEKNKEITEDEKFKSKDQIQEIIDNANKKLDESFEKKQTQIKQ
jgi:ribosome recycling factor